MQSRFIRAITSIDAAAGPSLRALERRVVAVRLLSRR
jgi:hypothetical protein